MVYAKHILTEFYSENFFHIFNAQNSDFNSFFFLRNGMVVICVPLIKNNISHQVKTFLFR